jgi:hypothetical protein
MAARRRTSGGVERSNSAKSILKPCCRKERRVASRCRKALLGAASHQARKITTRAKNPNKIFQRSFMPAPMANQHFMVSERIYRLQ